MRHLRFSQRSRWRFKSAGVLDRVAWLRVTDVSFTQRNIAEDLSLDLCYVYFCDVATDSLWLVFQPFYNGGDTNNFFRILRNPTAYENFSIPENKKAVGHTRGLLRYCQLVKKKSLYISRIILNCWPYFSLFFVFIPRFLAEPFTAFSSALVGKYRFRLTSCFKELMNLIVGLADCRSYVLRGSSWCPSSGPGLTCLTLNVVGLNT